MRRLVLLVAVVLATVLVPTATPADRGTVTVHASRFGADRVRRPGLRPLRVHEGPARAERLYRCVCGGLAAVHRRRSAAGRCGRQRARCSGRPAERTESSRSRTPDGRSTTTSATGGRARSSARTSPSSAASGSSPGRTARSSARAAARSRNRRRSRRGRAQFRDRRSTGCGGPGRAPRAPARPARSRARRRRRARSEPQLVARALEERQERVAVPRGPVAQPRALGERPGFPRWARRPRARGPRRARRRGR